MPSDFVFGQTKPAQVQKLADGYQIGLTVPQVSADCLPCGL
jgi:hypothetical protein